MIFETQSGSVYELDTEASRIRRLSGLNDPQPRQGKDGEWRTYVAVSDVRVGCELLIAWDPKTTPLLSGSPEFATPTTLTSRVKVIQ